MKRFYSIVIFLFIINNTYQIFSKDLLEYNKAMEYLEERGEVYYIFYINSPSELRPLFDIISIDRINRTEIYAYANKEEFYKFLEHDLYYEVLTPPSLLINPEMSDYSDGGPYEWDKYPSYDGYINILNDFEANYPELCKVFEVGKTTMDRTIFAVKITDNVDENEPEPKFLQSAVIHGDEVLNFMSMFHMMDYLLSNYQEDEFVTKMIDSVEMWIIPSINPDGTYRQGNGSVKGATRYNSNNVDLNRNFPDPEKGLYPQGSWEQETKTMVEWEKDFFFELQIDWHGGIESALWPWACWSRKHPDDAWYRMISEEYAELAQNNSPSGYFTWKGGSGNCFVDWGEIHGTRLDYQPYYRHGPGVTIETSTKKLLPESQLLDHWDYNIDAMRHYYAEIFYGIRGTVTDSLTGEGIFAKIFVENHDNDSSWIFSNVPHGDYYRFIFEGSYALTFTSENYFPKTISDVDVESKKATILNVQLRSTITNNNYNNATLNSMGGISVIAYNRSIKISFDNARDRVEAVIYDIGGKLIEIVTAQPTAGKSGVVWNGLSNTGKQVGNGCYIVRIQTPENTYSKHFVFTH